MTEASVLSDPSEKIDAVAEAMFLSLRSGCKWAAIDEGDRNYWRLRAIAAIAECSKWS